MRVLLRYVYVPGHNSCVCPVARVGGFFHHLNVQDWQQTALLEKASQLHVLLLLVR
jgi:5'(3')-deoxyribonucleotidase